MELWRYEANMWVYVRRKQYCGSFWHFYRGWKVFVEYFLYSVLFDIAIPTTPPAHISNVLPSREHTQSRHRENKTKWAKPTFRSCISHFTEDFKLNSLNKRLEAWETRLTKNYERNGEAKIAIYLIWMMVWEHWCFKFVVHSGTSLNCKSLGMND